MPRVSVAARSILPIAGVERFTRPDAPDDLTKEQAEIWRHIDDTMPSDWFPPETHHILSQYCVHVAGLPFINNAIAEIEKSKKPDLELWAKLEKARRDESMLITTMATKMRLPQQSSYDKKKSKTVKSRSANMKPWG